MILGYGNPKKQSKSDGESSVIRTICIQEKNMNTAKKSTVLILTLLVLTNTLAETATKDSVEVKPKQKGINHFYWAFPLAMVTVAVLGIWLESVMTPDSHNNPSRN